MVGSALRESVVFALAERRFVLGEGVGFPAVCLLVSLMIRLLIIFP